MSKPNRTQKRKQKKQLRPQASYQQQLANLSLKNMAPYIDEQVYHAAQVIARQTNKQLIPMFERLVVLEEILIENIPSLDREMLAEKVALKQDSREGFEQKDTVEEGDRVRIEIKTKTDEDKDFTGASRILIDNVGSGATIGKELEPAIVGLKRDDVKEVQFGEDKKMTASIRVHMVSSQPKKEEPKEEKVETLKEEVNESANA